MENAQALTFRAKPTLDPREGVASGLLRLLFAFLFGDRFAKIINELEALFEAWRAGTLPPIPATPPASNPRQPQPRSRRPQAARNRARVRRLVLTRAHRTTRALSYAKQAILKPAKPGRLPPRIERPPRQKTACVPNRKRTPISLRFLNE